MTKFYTHRKVTMYFQPELLETFLSVFEESKDQIRAFPGCLSLQLIQDLENPSICGTSSIWESEEALEAYRHSELFYRTWAKTKPLFVKKAEAQSFRVLHWLP